MGIGNQFEAYEIELDHEWSPQITFSMEFIRQVHQLKTLNASTTLIVITMAYANTPHSKLVF
jgi:hypothetical protein